MDVPSCSPCLDAGPEQAADVDPAALGDLLVSSGRGDVGSFGQLYDLTSARVHAIVLRSFRGLEAEQVTVQIYVRLWHLARSFVPSEAHPLAWIVSLAHHVASDHGPPPGRARSNLPMGDGPCAGLSRQQQDILTLVYLGGYSQRQVAELLHVPRPAVSSTLREGLHRLRVELPAAS